MKLKLTLVLMLGLMAMSSCGDKEQLVLITTNMGDIKIKLYNETPKHRDNFIKLVKDKMYDQTLFHRVIQGFMIQGGDPDSKGAAPGARLGNGGPGYTIDAEFVPSLFHKKGALAAARQGDQVNPEKKSSGSQFYIVHGNGPMKEGDPKLKNVSEERKKVYMEVGGTPFLDDNYTVFGEVVEGFDVIDKIAAVPRDAANRPLEDVYMQLKLVRK